MSTSQPTRPNHPDLRSLQCFVAVAEELNFAKAAQRMSISQPPLTKRIQLLEEELGVVLFERTTRSVRLTAAGSVLLREARRLFEQSLAMQRAVQQIDRTDAGTLRVGFVSTAFLGVIQPNLDRLTSELGAVEYVWSEMTSPEQVAAVRNRQIDLAFVHTPLEHRELSSMELQDESFVAALPHRHALASRSSIRLEELGEEAFAMFPREVAPAYHDMLLAACSAAGFAPRVQHHPRNFMALLLLPAGGCGVSVVPAPAAKLAIPGLALVPIRDDTLRAQVKMLWHPDNHAPMLLRAVGAIAAGCLSQRGLEPV